jgi:uncharacterized protein YigE (DUF2233 family)
MRRVILAFLLLAACRDAPSVAETQASLPVSACNERQFEDSRFTICDPGKGPIEVITGEPPYREFAKLEAALGKRRVSFAMNGGMFGEDGRAIGLLVENGKQVHAINRREGGGNFHLMPNGVFLVRRDGSAAIIPSDACKPSHDVAFATQSGPMLVIAGKLHPRFDADGTSRNIRNGVGIARDGRPRFVISEDPVSFGKFARLFRDVLGAKNALYFDGSVSSLWDPANGRRDSHAPLGPMVVVFKREGSAPHP